MCQCVVSHFRKGQSVGRAVSPPERRSQSPKTMPVVSTASRLPGLSTRGSQSSGVTQGHTASMVTLSTARTMQLYACQELEPETRSWNTRGQRGGVACRAATCNTSTPACLSVQLPVRWLIPHNFFFFAAVLIISLSRMKNMLIRGKCSIRLTDH